MCLCVGLFKYRKQWTKHKTLCTEIQSNKIIAMQFNGEKYLVFFPWANMRFEICPSKLILHILSNLFPNAESLSRTQISRYSSSVLIRNIFQLKNQVPQSLVVFKVYFPNYIYYCVCTLNSYRRVQFEFMPFTPYQRCGESKERCHIRSLCTWWCFKDLFCRNVQIDKHSWSVRKLFGWTMRGSLNKDELLFKCFQFFCVY